jgi:hypothetical protein
VSEKFTILIFEKNSKLGLVSKKEAWAKSFGAAWLEAITRCKKGKEHRDSSFFRFGLLCFDATLLGDCKVSRCSHCFQSSAKAVDRMRQTTRIGVIGCRANHFARQLLCFFDEHVRECKAHRTFQKHNQSSQRFDSIFVLGRNLHCSSFFKAVKMSFAADFAMIRRNPIIYSDANKKPNYAGPVHCDRCGLRGLKVYVSSANTQQTDLCMTCFNALGMDDKAVVSQPQNIQHHTIPVDDHAVSHARSKSARGVKSFMKRPS